MSKPDIKIKFKGISVLSKALNAKPKNEFNKETFNFDINGQTLVQPDTKGLVTIFKVEIKELNKESVLGSISIACEFQLENFDEILPPREDNEYEIPRELDALIKTMSLSTARGIMYSEFKGSYLGKAILPIIFLPTAPTDSENEQGKPNETST